MPLQDMPVENNVITDNNTGTQQLHSNKFCKLFLSE
jgi:hypothetical protein